MTTTVLADLDAEESVLSALLQGPSVAAIHRLRELLPGPEVFATARHRTIYRGWLALAERGAEVDALTLRDELQRQGIWDEVDGGLVTLSELVDVVPTPAVLLDHAEVVRDRWLRRELQTVAQRAQAKAADLAVPIAGAFPETVTELVQAATPLSVEAPRPVAGLVYDALQRIEARDQAEGALEGPSFGLRDLDALLGGVVPGRLIIGAARPGQGKSSFGMHVALAVASQDVGTVYVLSLEMSREELVQRTLGAVADVPLHRLGGQRLSDRDYARLAKAGGTLSQLPLVIDTTSRTPGQLRLALQHFRATSGQTVALVVVDYLTLLRWPHKTERRDLEVGKLTWALKMEIARDLGVPVLCLTQLRRIQERRPPVLNDLRESGNIEQDADQVVMLHYEGAEDGVTATEGWGAATRTELYVRKNRHGPGGKLHAYYDRRTQRWDDLAFRPAVTEGAA
jgi:replicative DNA helicase